MRKTPVAFLFRGLLAAWVLALVAGLLQSPSYASAELVVIVHKDNPTATLDVIAIKKFYLGQKSEWPHAIKAMPFDRTGGSERSAFFAKVLDSNEDDFARYWMRKQYASGASAPAQLASESAMIERVANNPGSLGFVSAAAIAGAGSNVKVLMRVTY